MLDSQLLLPLTLNQKPLGVPSLGPKQLEAPFSTSREKAFRPRS